MSKKKETPRSSVPNKKSTPSIYRKIEMLAISLLKSTSNIPNVPMVQESAKRLTNELLECCAAVGYAYSVPEFDVRYDYLINLEVHLTMVETIIKLLFEYASQSNSRFMTPDQHAQYLMNLDSIEDQCQRWIKSTEKNISRNKVISTQDVGGSPESEFIQTKGSGKSDDFSVPENTHFMALGPDRVITNTPFGDLGNELKN